MKDTIDKQIATIRQVLEASYNEVSNMTESERVSVKKLASKVAKEVTMEAKHILGFVNYFAHNNDISYVTRGKYGGLVKGTKVVKPAKPKTTKAKNQATDPPEVEESLTDLDDLEDLEEIDL